MAGVELQLRSGGSAPKHIFTTNTIGVTHTLESLFGSAIVNGNSVFDIVVNGGVTVKGPNGANGNPGGTGGPAFNFSTVTGKTINIINNGIISSGDGGNGTSITYYKRANGSWSTTPEPNCNQILSSTTPVLGGITVNGITTGNNTCNIIGNSAVNGVNGTNGVIRYYTYNYCDCDCSSCSSCFIMGTLITMYDGTKKKIEDVRVGDVVLGAFGEPNTVKYTKTMPGVFDGKYVNIYNINNLYTTPEHPFVSGDRKEFFVPEIEAGNALVDHYVDAIDADGNTVSVLYKRPTKAKFTEFTKDSTVYTERGSEKVDMRLTDLKADIVYHLILEGGSKSYCANGVFVLGFMDDEAYLKYYV